MQASIPTRARNSGHHNGWRLLLVLLGAAGYAVHVQVPSLGTLGFVSTAPWLLLALHPTAAGRPRDFLLLVYLMALLAFDWLAAFNLRSYLVAPLFYLGLFLPLFVVPRFVRARLPHFPLSLLWAVVFTATEWVRVRFSPGEPAVGLLGYSQVEFAPLIQIADVTGVAGVTFLLSSVAGLCAEALLIVPRRPTPGEWKSLRLQGAGIGVLMGATLLYGVVPDRQATLRPGPRLLVLQPALEQGFVASGRVINPPDDLGQRNLRYQSLMTSSSVAGARADAVLWPEFSLLAVISGQRGALDTPTGQAVCDLAQHLDLPILVDGPSRDGRTGAYFHTAFFIRPDGGWEQYDKIRVLPWSEYTPGIETARWLGSAPCAAYVQFVRSTVGDLPIFHAGELVRLQPFHLVTREGASYSFGTPICFEISSARVVNAWHRCVDANGRQGVDFLVNPTSEGLLGGSIHQQTLTICRFRAVEGRVAVVRASNNGISALIDPNGEVRDMLCDPESGAASTTTGTLLTRLVIGNGRGTIYTRLGDWFPEGCLILMVGFVGFAGWRGATTKRLRLNGTCRRQQGRVLA